MRQREKGVIVNTASVAGLRGGAAGGTYVASKHAVVGLTRSIAWSHGNEGIRCNAICPGAIETNITGGKGLKAFDQAGLKRSEEHTSELQSLMRISYAVFCLKKKTKTQDQH